MEYKKFLDKSKFYIFVDFKESIFYKFVDITNKLVRKVNRNSNIFIEKLVPKNYKPANNIIANNIIITKQNSAGPIPIANMK